MLRKHMSLKTLIVGIDGADWRIVQPLVEQGQLPNLEAMMQEGAFGDLLSVCPHNSAAAWSSFQTGLNPGKHGLYDFYKSGGLYERGIISAESLRGRTMWDILGSAGYKVGVMNMPITYPPRQVNGFLIPGVLTPARDRIPTFPEGLLDRKQNYVVEPTSPLMFKSISPLDYLDALIRSIVARGEVALELALEWPWDFFAVVFTETDRLQHFYWKYVDPDHPGYDPEKAPAFASRFRECYRQIDRTLGALRDLAGEEVLAMVVSDHGFGPVTKGIDLSTWLAEQGYLSFVRNTRHSLARKAIHLAQMVDVLGLRKSLPSRKTGPAIRRVSLPTIDWAHTIAYPGTLAEQGIYINVRGRERDGIVEPGAEYEEVRERLISQLLAFRDPSSGLPLVRSVTRKEEVVSGPFLDFAPDLFLEPADSKHLFVNRLSDPYRLDLDSAGVYGMSGHHRREGILVAAGPPVKALGRARPAQITDICPTVLYAMGAPIPEDMDGQTMDQIFREDFPQTRGPRRSKVVTDEALDIQPDFSADETEEIRARLRGLGYL